MDLILAFIKILIITKVSFINITITIMVSFIETITMVVNITISITNFTIVNMVVNIIDFMLLTNLNIMQLLFIVIPFLILTFIIQMSNLLIHHHSKYPIKHQFIITKHPFLYLFTLHPKYYLNIDLSYSILLLRFYWSQLKCHLILYLF